MKRAFKIVIVMIIFIYIFSFRSNTKDSLFGTYIFDTTSSLSPLSSYTKDYINEKMEGAQFIFLEDLFIAETLNKRVEIKYPVYKKEALNKDSKVLQEAVSYDENLKYKYTIFDKDGNRTNWRIYTSSKNVWIALIADNNANGQELIIYKFKLVKSM